MAEIKPITHVGHETTYCYEVHRGDVTYHINAANSAGVIVSREGEGGTFPSLKSALNFALGAVD